MKGEIPSKKVYEDDNTFAFLDINPANPGHTLVIPKKHSDSIFEVDEEDLQNAIVTVKKIAVMIKDTLNVEGVNIIQNNGKLAGQIVSHTHFHVIPRKEGDSVVINYPRKQTTEQELDEVVQKLGGAGSGSPASSLDDEILGSV
jgi:histidine triad (HIT) family protein